MRKFFTTLFALWILMTLWVCAPAASAAEFSGGKGTAADPYRISTAEDLWNLAEKVNDKNVMDRYNAAHYRMTQNIDLGGKKKWIPIGNYQHNSDYYRFEGSFDGDGYTLSGLKIKHQDPLFGKNKQPYVGLFGRLEGTVKNLVITDSTIAAEGEGSLTVGTIAGQVFNGTVENCVTRASVTVTGSYTTGGICGEIMGESFLSGCTNGADVTATGTVGYAGGIAGKASCPVEACSNSGNIVSEQGEAAGIAVTVTGGITDCENTGRITAEDEAAGIVCHFSDGALNHSMNDDTVQLLRCTNSGEVTSLKDLAGGIAAGCRTGSVVDCVNSGSVTAQKEVGGILAYYQNDSFGAPCELFTVSGCENSGTVTSTENESAGGICGRIYGDLTRLVFENCENSGSVIAAGKTDVLVSSARAGGIVGSGRISGLELRGCVNSGSVKGYTYAGGILGEASAARDVEESVLLAHNCENSGKIYAVYPGGLTQELYAGGIVGFCKIETEDPETAPVFDILTIEECKNTGKLDGDREKEIRLCTDDLCAAWKSELE